VEGGFAGWCRCRTSDKNTSKFALKRHSLRSCQRFKKDSEEVSAGIGILNIIKYVVSFPAT
jgi:hypothetical protein